MISIKRVNHSNYRLVTKPIGSVLSRLTSASKRQEEGGELYHCERRYRKTDIQVLVESVIIRM